MGRRMEATGRVPPAAVRGPHAGARQEAPLTALRDRPTHRQAGRIPRRGRGFPRLRRQAPTTGDGATHHSLPNPRCQPAARSAHHAGAGGFASTLIAG